MEKALSAYPSHPAAEENRSGCSAAVSVHQSFPTIWLR